MINRVHLALLPGGYIYMHASETCSSDRLHFTEELEKKTRPKHHREKDEVVMEIKLEGDYTISDTAEIRSLLHYCLECMHYTLGVFFVQPCTDVGVITSASWHMTPQVIEKYDPRSTRANHVECRVDSGAGSNTIPKSALTPSCWIEKAVVEKKSCHGCVDTSNPSTSSAKADIA